MAERTGRPPRAPLNEPEELLSDEERALEYARACELLERIYERALQERNRTTAGDED
jgi:hypothetical protein